MKYVIIGAGIAGTTAAETIRSIDSSAEISIITREAYPLYSRITIAAYAGGKVQKDQLMLRKDGHFENKNITFLPGLEVNSIDRQKKIVHTQKDIPYDKLLIATGGSPYRLNIPGSEGKGIFYLYTLDDGTTIKEYCAGKSKAIVIGGGFIGIDFVNTFLDLGMQVDFLIREEGFASRIFDPQAQQIIHDLLTEKGVNIHTNTEITEFTINEQHAITGVRTQSNEVISCEVAGLGLGINRISDFIKNSDIAYKEGVLANQYLQTNDPDIYVAGDIAQYYDLLTLSYRFNGDWSSARNQGVCAGRNMAGQLSPYLEVTTNTINIFGTNVSMTGMINDETCNVYTQVEGKRYIKLFTNAQDIVIGGIVIGNPEYTIKLRTAIKAKKATKTIDI